MEFELLNQKSMQHTVEQGKTTKVDFDINPHQQNTNQFFNIYQEWYELEEVRIGKTAAKHINNSMKILKQFRKNIEWKDIDYRLYLHFVSWMYTKPWSLNYIGKQIKNLRAVCEYGTNLQLMKSPIHRTFKTLSEKADNIYLPEKDLMRLYYMRSLPPAYEKARDLFLIGCWTGMRVGNYLYLKTSAIIDLKNNTITAITNKKGGKVVLPIHWMVREIIKKYNGLPPHLSEQRLNKYLKEICKAAKMYENILTRKTIGGKEQIIIKKRWEMVTTHTARRSCATNLHLRDVPITTIMLITNHKSEAQCREYIKDFTKNQVDKRVAALDFWTKKTEI